MTRQEEDYLLSRIDHALTEEKRHRVTPEFMKILHKKWEDRQKEKKAKNLSYAKINKQ